MFSNKTLTITGGTGSFGTAVLNRFLASNIKEIRIFSRDEKKQEDMRLFYRESRLKFYLGDVRNRDSLEEVMKGTDIVFHAAALKQVPSCEFYPMEAVRTNVLGAENVMDAAIASRVSRVILLSTDKAVYPINAMGMSKALMEKLMIAKSRQQSEGGTVLCATRYGNVMASRGSVIPLFMSQLKKNEPLTVTDPSMTRFLMSLKESVELVVHACEHAHQGDIFVQKAPASTIHDLAVALQELLRVEQNVKIIGTRHGEKLFETLVSREEMVRVQESDRFFRIPADSRDLNYSKYSEVGDDRASVTDDYTSHNTQRLGVEEIKAMLLNLEELKGDLNV